MVRIPQNTFALFSYPLTLDNQAYTLWEAVSGEAASGMAQALGGGVQPAAASASGTLSAADMQSMGNLAGGQPQMMAPMGGMQMQQPMMSAEPLGDFRRQRVRLRLHFAPEAALCGNDHDVHGSAALHGRSCVLDGWEWKIQRKC